MIELVRHRVLATDTRLQALLGAVSVTAFGWLLAADQIHPLVVYFLQMYLTF